MALKKTRIFKGIELRNAYHKITSVNVTETWEDETWKLYTTSVQVNSYTDETKEYDLEQRSYYFKKLREQDNVLSTLYWKLKLEKDFEWSIDLN